MRDARHLPEVELITMRIDVILGRLRREDPQLHHLDTYAVPLTERPTNAKERRGDGIARVLYTWLRRDGIDWEDVAKDIESLASLGRTDRWKSAVKTWAHIARTDSDMFQQYATYANYAAD